MNYAIIKKIKKLLALAADQDGRPEGERAAAIAHRLMAEHAVSMASLKDSGEQARVGAAPCTKSMWRRSLWATLAQHCNCACVLEKKGKGRKDLIVIIGFGHDVEVCQYLYEVCEREIDRAAKRLCAGLGKKHANDFRRSAVTGLAFKLQEQRGDVEQSTAMVLRSRLSRAEQERVRRYGFIRTARASKHEYSEAGFRTGYAINTNAPLKGQTNDAPQLEEA